MERVTIFGAGNVGSTTAFYLAHSSPLEINLIDVVEGRAKGLALDIGQSLALTSSSARVTGGSHVQAVENSKLVIITAGYPRQPGMSRLDLTEKNAPIVVDIARNVSKFAPDSVIIVITNPVDEMTYLAWRASNFEPRRVMGMAGVLDTSRFTYFLREIASVSPNDLSTFVLGSHGDEMVVLSDSSKVCGKPLSQVIDDLVLQNCVERTRDAGAEIVGLLKSGSAYFAPATSIGTMALAILGDTSRLLPVTAYLQGEYGISGVFVGVPARLGKCGIVEVVEIELSRKELEGLQRAALSIKKRAEALEGFLR